MICNSRNIEGIKKGKERIIRMNIFLLAYAIFALSIFSEVCEYRYEPKNTKIKWQAYKFTERVGVEGSIENIQVQQPSKATNLKEFAESIRFKIDTKLLTTNNVERDLKIQKYFFGNLSNPNEITGELKNFKMDDDLGKLDLVLKMNSIESSIPVDFVLRKKKYVEMNGKLNVVQWGAGKALDSLNKECESVHKGKDGITKLWNDINFYLSTELVVICKP